MQKVLDAIIMPYNKEYDDITININPSNKDFSQSIRTLHNRMYIRAENMHLGNNRICDRSDGINKIIVQSIDCVTISFHNVFLEVNNDSKSDEHTKILKEDGLQLNVTTNYVNDPHPRLMVNLEPDNKDPFFKLLMNHLLSYRQFQWNLKAYIKGVQLASDYIYISNSNDFMKDEATIGYIPENIRDLRYYNAWIDHLFDRTQEQSDQQIAYTVDHPELANINIMIQDLKIEVDRLNTKD